MSDQPEDLWLVDRLLAGDPHGESPALTSLLAATTAPATPREHAGEEAVLAAFAAASLGLSPSPLRARRLSMLSTLLAGKVVTAAAAAGIAIAGTAAAAYTGSLPDRLQDIAHTTIGAPAAHHADNAGRTPVTAHMPAPSATGRPATATPVGPDASGTAAFGLCTAWGKGGLATKSVAYDSLVRAAGGADKIKDYCATVAHPGKAEAHATSAPTGHPTGSPTTHATGAPETRPTTPETHPTGEPTKPAGR